MPWTEAGISTGYSRDVCVCHGVNGVGDRQRKEFLCFIISFCLFSFLLEQSLRIVLFLLLIYFDKRLSYIVQGKFQVLHGKLFIWWIAVYTRGGSEGDDNQHKRQR